LRRFSRKAKIAALFGAAIFAFWAYSRGPNATDMAFVAKAFDDIPLTRTLAVSTAVPVFISRSVCHYAIVEIASGAASTPPRSQEWTYGRSPWLNQNSHSDNDDLKLCIIVDLTPEAERLARSLAVAPDSWWKITNREAAPYSRRQGMAMIFKFIDEAKS
jgi:hypothetical protein